MSVLRVENLSKRYGKKQVLKGITCEFHTGINALLGPNGAGKTTIGVWCGIFPKRILVCCLSRTFIMRTLSQRPYQRQSPLQTLL